MTPLESEYHSFCFGFRIKIGVEMDKGCFSLFKCNIAHVIDDFINEDATSGVVLSGIVHSERFQTLYDSR